MFTELLLQQDLLLKNFLECSDKLRAISDADIIKSQLVLSTIWFPQEQLVPIDYLHYLFQSKGEPFNKVRSQSPAERINWIKTGNLSMQICCIIPLCHSLIPLCHCLTLTSLYKSIFQGFGTVELLNHLDVAVFFHKVFFIIFHAVYVGVKIQAPHFFTVLLLNGIISITGIILLFCFN